MKDSKSWHICYLADASVVHTQRWAQHFARIGHRVTVISFVPYEIPGCHVIYVKPITPWIQLNYLLSLFNVRRMIQALQPNILHAHYAIGYGFLGAMAGVQPYVITAWGTDVLVRPVKSRLYRALVVWAFRRANMVTSMADHMTKHIVEHGYASAEKVITLPFGVDTDLFHPGHRKAQHSGPPYLVISNRRHAATCDVQTFIKAAPLVLEQEPETNFVVGSNGPLRSQLEALSAKLGVSNKLNFTGWLPLQELLCLLGRADVLVSTAPSDGNNVTLNEGMACGAFPVATDIPANQQWIVSGENGLLFPPGDEHAFANCIVQALRDPQKRNRAAQINWQIVQQRASWQDSMKKMEKHYESLVVHFHD
ncbi:MAG: glycosyltransferase family 4 protein [Chloroflexota bacterium]